MSRRSGNRKRGKTGRGFSMLIHDYFTSQEYAELSPRAVKALVDLYCQFKGHNNGDLSAAWKLMAPLGWTSKDQLAKAVAELLERGWISTTRMGGKRVARLYAVTWLGIDPCGGKLDCKPNAAPAMSWRRSEKSTLFPRPTGQSAPPHGSMEEANGELCPAPRVNRAHFPHLIDPPHGTLLRSMPSAGGLPAVADAATRPPPDEHSSAQDRAGLPDSDGTVVDSPAHTSGPAAPPTRAENQPMHQPSSDVLIPDDQVKQRLQHQLAADGSIADASARSIVAGLVRGYRGIEVASEVLHGCERLQLVGDAARRYLNERRAMRKLQHDEERRRDRALAKELAHAIGLRPSDDELKARARGIERLRGEGWTDDMIRGTFERLRRDRPDVDVSHPIVLLHLANQFAGNGAGPAAKPLKEAQSQPSKMEACNAAP